MNTVVRLFAFSVLPVLLAALHVRLSPRAMERGTKIEIYLIYLFMLGVGGGGLSGFFGHIFIPDEVAESIGWEEGSPFQQEMGFANLALGVLGFVAASRRDGFREATVVAVTVLAVGASLVHLVDIIENGNLAAGNSIQIVANLLKPAVLIPLLRMSRSAEVGTEPSSVDASFDSWRFSVVRHAAIVTGVVGAGFGIGYSLDLAWATTLLAALVAAAITARFAARP